MLMMRLQYLSVFVCDDNDDIGLCTQVYYKVNDDEDDDDDDIGDHDNADDEEERVLPFGGCWEPSGLTQFPMLDSLSSPQLNILHSQIK